MHVKVSFYSYFKDLTGSADLMEPIREGETLAELLDRLAQRFPKLGAMRKSILAAVGVDYQTGDYNLKNGDEISLFPPVQGG
jgi:molybdopterin converting factor small subunit